MVGEKTKVLYEAAAKERQKAGGDRGRQKQKGLQDNCPEPIPDTGQSRDKAAEALGISGKSIDRAAKVRRSGIPELVSAVESGTVAVSAAAKVAELPQSFQQVQ